MLILLFRNSLLSHDWLKLAVDIKCAYYCNDFQKANQHLPKRYGRQIGIGNGVCVCAVNAEAKCSVFSQHRHC